MLYRDNSIPNRSKSKFFRTIVQLLKHDLNYCHINRSFPTRSHLLHFSLDMYFLFLCMEGQQALWQTLMIAWVKFSSHRHTFFSSALPNLYTKTNIWLLDCAALFFFLYTLCSQPTRLFYPDHFPVKLQLLVHICITPFLGNYRSHGHKKIFLCSNKVV